MSFDNTRMRLAGAADTETLVQLINAAFVVERIAIEGDRVDAAGVQKYMQAGQFLLLELDGSAAGCVYIEKRGDRGYLGLLSVGPERQKLGLGRKLADAGEQHARAQGCRAMDLRVISARQELLPFYEKLGYAVTHSSAMPAEVPLKIPCHFIHMSKDLR
jgi:GNAT superfamily N-acetyltransferase